LLKGYEYILKNLKLFDVEKSDWYWDKEKICYYYFKTKKKKLPETYEQKGPSKDHPVHVKRFKKKYKKTYLVKGTIHAKVKREIRELDKTIENLNKQNYLKQKIRGVKIVK